ncbi:DoxX family protein [Spirosoma arcticum]
MKNILTIGRLLYAIAIASLGVKMLVVGGLPADLIRKPEALPDRAVLGYVVGSLLVIIGGCIALKTRVRVVALALTGVLILFAVSSHLPALLTNPANPAPWTPFFELVALAGGALVLAGWFSPGDDGGFRDGPDRALSQWGRYLFAGSLLVFGGLHFLFAPFIATLIPAWIPGQLFWAYFVGVAFVATAVSLLLNRYVSVSTAWLGSMFLLWVIVLHGPRAVAKPHVEPEWTSLLIALAMSGVAFVLAGSAQREKQAVGRLAQRIET